MHPDIAHPSSRPIRVGLALSSLCLCSVVFAEQFVLFDQTFTFEEKDSVSTKSHLHVLAEQFGEDTPKDWTFPCDYRNGRIHIRLEVLEKPEGGARTFWSLCYIPIRGQNRNYGCVTSPSYTETGVYYRDESMAEFWENDSIIWSEGIKKMSLVLKGPKVNGKAHAHLQPDPKLYFPTKIRVTMVQVSKDSEFDPSKILHWGGS